MLIKCCFYLKNKSVMIKIEKANFSLIIKVQDVEVIFFLNVCLFRRFLILIGVKYKFRSRWT